MSHPDPGMDEREDWLVSLDAIRSQYQRTFFDARLVTLERGTVLFELPVRPQIMGGAHGGVHGGILAAVVDIASVAAVLSACRQGDVMRGTAELSVSYIRPAVGDMIAVTAHVLRKGATLSVIDVDIHNVRGELAAKGRVTYVLGRDAPRE